MKIRYAGAANTLQCSLIKQWERGCMDGPAMSISSGPKDYLKNDVWTLLEKGAERVLLLRSDAPGKGWGALFFVSQSPAGGWTDAIGKAVEVFK